MIQVEWDADEQEYVATNTDWPYLTAFGDTEEEAREDLEQLVQASIEILREDD